MAIKPANIQDCKLNKRCLAGPNVGLAYSPGDECYPGSTFVPATCDCIPNTPTYNFKILCVFAGGTEVAASWTSFEVDANQLLMWQTPSSSSGTSFSGNWPGEVWASSVTISNVNDCGGIVTIVAWARYGDPSDPGTWGAPFNDITADFTGTSCNSMCGNSIPGCDGKSWTANLQYFRESVPGSGTFDTPFNPLTGT